MTQHLPPSNSPPGARNILGDGIGFCHVYRVAPQDGDQEIVDFARVCVAGLKPVESNRGLIRYLMRHRHTTPFESVQVWIHVKAPIFVARQWFRHRTWSYNEISGRYAELPPGVYDPQKHEWRAQSSDNRQGSDPAIGLDQTRCLLTAVPAYEASRIAYEKLLALGVAREQARFTLPLAQYTEWRCSVDLWNLMHFLGLRLDPHAQAEIQAYAKSILGQLRPYAPLAMDAFEDYHLKGETFSSAEMELLRECVSGRAFSTEAAQEKGLSLREIQELQAKLG